MEELYINNVEIDLPENSIALTSQINDIAELKDRQSNYTNSIKIPRTAKNIATFEMLGITGNTTRKPYENLSIKYIVDGIELIESGVGVIKSTNQFYNLVIYSGISNLFEDIKNLKINELDFSAYNHNLDVATWENSHSNTSGYIYGVASFYDPNVDNAIYLQNCSPSFYIHTLFEMIFTQAGYTFSGDIFTDSDYKSRVLTMPSGIDRAKNSGITLKSTDTRTSADAVYESFGSTVTTKRYAFDSYTVTEDGVFRVTGIGGIPTIDYGTNYEVSIGGGGFNDGVTGFINIPIDDFFGYSGVEASCEVGDVITFYIKATSTFDTDISEQAIGFSPNYTSNIYLIVENYVVNFEDEIGETTQLDLIKDVMQRFGLVINRKRNTKEYEFVKMETLLNDYSGAVDYSNKYSNFLSESYKPNYAKRNLFKFKYKSDVLNEYANGVLDVNNETLQDEKTVLTSIFTANNDVVDTIDNVQIVANWEFDVDDRIYVPIESSLNIFKLTNKTRTIAVRYELGNSAVFVYTDSRPYLTSAGINYQDEIDNNYNSFNRMLDDYKKIVIEVNLNLIDFYNVDFLKLATFSQLGKHYYINKISNFKKGILTKIELVEV